MTATTPAYSVPAGYATHSQRAAGQEHIPSYPRGFIALRILQLVFTLIVLGLTAYTVAVLPFAGNCLMLFTALVSLITTIWLTSAHSCARQVYNYWAVLALDIFLTIFWLISFALLAVQAGWLFAVDSYYYYYDSDYDYYDYDYDSDVYDSNITFASILAAAAGLGALNFLLFLISLIIHSCVTYRHRRAGLHSKPVQAGGEQPYPMTTPGNPNYAAGAAVPHDQQQQQYNPQAVYAQAPMQQQMPPQGYPPQQQQQGGYYAPNPQQGYYGAPPSSQGQTVSPIAAQPTGTSSISKPSSPQPQVVAPTPYHPPAQPTQHELGPN